MLLFGGSLNEDLICGSVLSNQTEGALKNITPTGSRCLRSWLDRKWWRSSRRVRLPTGDEALGQGGLHGPALKRALRFR